LKESDINNTFESCSRNEIPKESIEIIFKEIMSGSAKSSQDAIQKLGTIDELELNKKLDEIIQKNSELIKKQGQRSIGPIMGIAMKELRGKADGETINKLLNKKINLELNNKN